MGPHAPSLASSLPVMPPRTEEEEERRVHRKKTHRKSSGASRSSRSSRGSGRGEKGGKKEGGDGGGGKEGDTELAKASRSKSSKNKKAQSQKEGKTKKKDSVSCWVSRAMLCPMQCGGLPPQSPLACAAGAPALLVAHAAMPCRPALLFDGTCCCPPQPHCCTMLLPAPVSLLAHAAACPRRTAGIYCCRHALTACLPRASNLQDSFTDWVLDILCCAVGVVA